MGRARQAGLVIGGYVAAFGAAALAGGAYDVRVSSLPYDTSGGMYAGGQLLQELGVFLLVALLPTLRSALRSRRDLVVENQPFASNSPRCNGSRSQKTEAGALFGSGFCFVLSGFWPQRRWRRE